jgi:hydrogenase large subunit
MADNRKEINFELNRVEGDLELKVAVEGQRIVDARAIGRMYRGFEQILIGRHSRDGLVITPRICGICGTAHLYAAVTALETAWQCPVAPNGTRVRNLCLMTEEAQSDSRHTFLMFAIDLCNAKYRHHPLYPLIQEAFAPFSGRIYGETIRHTKQLLEIVAIFGGQWPHSSYMIPGGVTTVSNRKELIRVQTILDSYLRWYESSILGCGSERWLALRSKSDFEAWLDEQEAHRQSAAGLFLRFGREVGLAGLGRGGERLLSYGAYFDPEAWHPPFGERSCLRRPGFINGTTSPWAEFSAERIAEHIEYSWFARESGSGHPQGNRTIPAYDPNSKRYSWAKAPRYDGQVVEVGPLAELVVAGDPFITSLWREEGATVWLRELARLHRPVLTLAAMGETVRALLTTATDDPYYLAPEPVATCSGSGLVQAARGGLGHWLSLVDGRIAGYQIISPTTWNASPRDNTGRPGHWEQTLIGTEIEDLENPIELEHIIRCHDACLVCCVHFVTSGRRISFAPGC